MEKIEEENILLDETIKKESILDDDIVDYNKLPDSIGETYSRDNLNNQIVTIKAAQIKKPNPEREWKKSLTSNSYYKPYRFIVYFDTENNDREYYSGVYGFRNSDGSISLPTINIKKNKTQAAQLFNLYKNYIINKKGISEEQFNLNYGLRQFMIFLNSKPKVRIETRPVEFNDTTTDKNFIVEFI